IITGQVPDPIVSEEDAALSVTLSNLTVTDPDDTYPDDFTLTLFDGENYSVTGANAITPAPNYNGLLVVQLQVNDPEASSPLFGLSVDVTPVNDPPVITGQSVLQTEEETPLTITVADLIIDDPDLPAQEQTLTLQPGTGYSLEGNTVTPDENIVGTLLVPATVNDGESDSAPFELSIEVGAVNDKPVIDDQLPLSTPEETALLITLNDLIVSDPDNTYPDDFTLTVQDGTNYTRTGNSVLPTVDFNGDLLVPVVVNDGQTDSDSFVLTVSIAPVNDVPIIVGQADLTTAEDTSLLVLVTDLVVTDPDNVFPMDFSLTLQAGSNYSLSGTTVTPDTNYNGQLDVPALVSDGIATSAPFILKITVSSENDTPVLEAPIADQQAVENEPFVFDVSGNFSDSDGDELTFTGSGLPPSGNISIDPDSGVISGTPNFNDTQDFPYEVTITATDDSGAAVSDGFQLTVAALDRANVALAIEVTPSPAMLQDETRWTFTASNAGPSDAIDVALNGDFFGQGLTVSAVQPSNCTVGIEANRETTFTCVLGDLATGATAFVVLTATRNMPGDIAVAAMAAAQGDLPIDPNLDDNDAQLSVSVASELSNGEVQTLGSSTARSFASGDVDGDGDEDLVVGTAAGQPVEIYRGSGFRLFEEGATVLPENASTEGIALTDLDGDGDPDLVFANSGGQPDSVYLNDGSGGFLASVGIGNTDSRDVAVADFSGDGQPDLAFATVQGNPVYLSDGAGGYIPTPDLGASMSLAVASADFNGDGRQDLVFANIGGPSTVWLNDNGTGFSPPIELSIGDSADVVVADFDGNGTPDLAFGRVPSTPGDIPANPVLLNDGAGNFQLAAALGAAATTDILAGDVDGDGFVDL
ncbi:MAG: FG-GAP-like repeat-containing protein, partial [Gammaproteobacteria bacterium]